MRDLRDHRWIILKACLFVLSGLLASALLVLEKPTLKVAALLTISVWSFCRAYYFAFYVIERYVDPTFRLSRLISLLRYATTKRPST